jgi:hypothetical protein
MSMYDTLRKFAPEASQIVRYVYFKSLARAEQDLNPIRNKLLPLGEIGRGFFDALKGVYVSAKERDKTSFFMKLYRNGATRTSSMDDSWRQHRQRLFGQV